MTASWGGVTFDSGHTFYGVLDCAVDHRNVRTLLLAWLPGPVPVTYSSASARRVFCGEMGRWVRQTENGSVAKPIRAQ